MAEEQDDSQKTEEPSQQRLDDARRRGQVATSRDLASAALLAVGTALCAGSASLIQPGLRLGLRRFLAEAEAPRLDPAATGQLLLQALGLLGMALAVPLALSVLAPIVASLAQHGFLWSQENLGFKAERVSPLAGFKRLFSLRGLTEFLKSLLKLAICLCAIGWALWPERAAIMGLVAVPWPAILGALQALLLRLLGTATVVLGAIGLLDYLHARFTLRRQLMMTRQEVLDEHKQNEGDPHIRQKLKQMRLERSRRRMMADVPKSTVVITNPTHVAIALRYEAGLDGAPRILAKGLDAVALRIRERAAAHDVPLVESPALARALYKACEVGELIPPSHYQAVAEIISYVLRLDARQAGA